MHYWSPSTPDRATRFAQRAVLPAVVVLASIVLVSVSAVRAAPGERVVAIPGLRTLAPGTDWGVNRYLQHIYEPLVRIDSQGNVAPVLATEWKQNGREWMLRLRSGVKFHNGDPFTAESVRTTIRVLKEQKKFPAILSSIDVDVVGSDSVRLTTSAPDPNLLRLIAGPTLLILPTTLLTRDGLDALAKQPVGTGPFKMVEFKPNEVLVLERNLSYWGPAQPVDRLILRSVADVTTRLAQVKTGRAGIAENVRADDLQPNGYRFAVAPSTSVYCLVFTTATDTNNSLRLAIAKNLDVQRLLRDARLSREGYALCPLTTPSGRAPSCPPLPGPGGLPQASLPANTAFRVRVLPEIEAIRDPLVAHLKAMGIAATTEVERQEPRERAPSVDATIARLGLIPFARTFGEVLLDTNSTFRWFSAPPPTADRLQVERWYLPLWRAETTYAVSNTEKWSPRTAWAGCPFCTNGSTCSCEDGDCCCSQDHCKDKRDKGNCARSCS